ncbi:MAG TPA: DNA polymerase IV [Opitutaceae bacterium]|nr:DNA polymerase IV [Opitutaceae bacterium]
MPPALTTIVHLDADAFFVACEQARDPSLRGKKCAVGGTTRGIISSASYEARAAGVYTPMPTTKALQVCPDLVMIPHTSGLYGRVSHRMFDLCETLTPYVERRSIDEGYLDLSPCGFRSQAQLEERVQSLNAAIVAELGISVSWGLAANKLVSGIASKLRKPKAFVVVPPGDEATFLASLAVGKLPGIGVKTEPRLAAAGLRTVADLLAAPEPVLRRFFGDGFPAILAMARGEDDSRVETVEWEAKSYSQQETFAHDIADPAEIERVAKRMIDELVTKLREDGKGARTLTVKIRYPGMEDVSAGHSLPQASDMETDFYPLLAPLLRTAWKQRRPLRLVCVRFSQVEEPARQLELFEAGEKEKRHKLAAAVDALKRARGADVVTRGHQLRGDGRSGA